jgi:hypothetical protein
MKRIVFISLLTTLAIGALLFVGCGNSDNGDGNASAPLIPEKAENIVSIAKDNLAQKLDVSLGEIKIHSLTEVEWYDTSLGSPEPGMAYDLIIVPGFIINFEAKGQIYEYHTDQLDRIILYENTTQYPASVNPADGVIFDPVTNKPTGIVVDKTVPPPIR